MPCGYPAATRPQLSASVAAMTRAGGRKVAVFAVDPGGTTGVAGVHVELRPTLKETLTDGLVVAKAAEVRGDYLAQGRELAAMWDRFVFTANVEASIELPDVHCVYENFLADPGRIGRGATDLTSTWVAAAATALMPNGEDVTWQTPSSAKGFAKDDRLRLWGLWQVGSAHQRDAMRHVALKLNGLID